MLRRQIQVLQPVYGEEEIAAVADVLRSGWVGLGPETGSGSASSLSRFISRSRPRTRIG